MVKYRELSKIEKNVPQAAPTLQVPPPHPTHVPLKAIQGVGGDRASPPGMARDCLSPIGLWATVATDLEAPNSRGHPSSSRSGCGCLSLGLQWRKPFLPLGPEKMEIPAHQPLQSEPVPHSHLPASPTSALSYSEAVRNRW